MAQPKIALFGIFGVQNIGNEVTLQAMLHNVRSSRPDADVYTISYVPQDTASRHAVAAVPVSSAYSRNSEAARKAARRGKAARLLRAVFRRLPAEIWDWYRAYRVLRGTNLVLMTGTGMLTDYSTNSFGYPYDILKWTAAARMAGSKVCFVGIGVGPIYERLSRAFIKSALGLAGYRSFRDENSKARLGELGINLNGDPVFPDLAFSLPQNALPAPTKNRRRERTVGLGLMHHVDIHVKNGRDPDQEYQAYLDKMCDFTEWLLAQGYRVRILQGDMRYDGEVRADFRAQMDRRNRSGAPLRIVDEDVETVGDLLNQLAEVDAVVSPRLHNLILALMLNKPVISISYDPKTDALLEELGLEKYGQQMEEVDVHKLIDQFTEMESNSPGIRSLISQRVDSYRELLEDQYRTILCDVR